MGRIIAEAGGPVNSANVRFVRDKSVAQRVAPNTFDVQVPPAITGCDFSFIKCGFGDFDGNCIEDVERQTRQPMRIRRVIWPLLSQYVFLFAMIGSSIAGWTLPWVSIAREVIVWSPAAALSQSSDQCFQAKGACCFQSIAARSHGPPSSENVCATTCYPF